MNLNSKFKTEIWEVYINLFHTKKTFRSPSRQLAFYLLCISILVGVRMLALTPTEALTPAHTQDSTRSP